MQQDGREDDGGTHDDEGEGEEEPRVSLREHLAEAWRPADQEDPFQLPEQGSWLLVQTLAGGEGGSDTYDGLAAAFNAATTKARAKDDVYTKQLKARLKDVMEKIKATDEHLAQLLMLAGDVAKRVTARSSDEWGPYDQVLVEARIGGAPRPLERLPLDDRDGAGATGRLKGRMYVLLQCAAGGFVGYDIDPDAWQGVAERVAFDDRSEGAPQPQLEKKPTAKLEEVSKHFHGVAVHTCWDTSLPVLRATHGVEHDASVRCLTGRTG